MIHIYIYKKHSYTYFIYTIQYNMPFHIVNIVYIILYYIILYYIVLYYIILYIYITVHIMHMCSHMKSNPLVATMGLLP